MADGAPPAEAPLWRSGAMVDDMVGGVAQYDAPLGGADGDAAVAKKLRAAALRAARRGGAAPLHRWHADTATALMPRLRHWNDLAGMSEEAVRRAAVGALRVLTGGAPGILFAVIKTWTDGWPSSFRRGKGEHRCPLCGRGRGGRVGHLVSCRRLAGAVADASGLERPGSVAAAVGLLPGSRVRRSPASSVAAPAANHLFLALRLDTHQTATAARDLKVGFRPVAGPALREAARHAVRRYGGV